MQLLEECASYAKIIKVVRSNIFFHGTIAFLVIIRHPVFI
jgi:hypothetical protein